MTKKGFPCLVIPADSRRESRALKSGFTLIEVMLSVALFAVLGLVCLTNYLVNMKTAERIKNQIDCFVLAGQTVFSARSDPENFPSSGDYDYPYDDYSYQVSTEDVTLTDTSSAETRKTLDFKISTLVVSGRGVKISLPLSAALRTGEKKETQ